LAGPVAIPRVVAADLPLLLHPSKDPAEVVLEGVLDLCGDVEFFVFLLRVQPALLDDGLRQRAEVFRLEGTDFFLGRQS